MKRVGVGLALGMLTGCLAPIWHAVDKGDVAHVERLLAAGADPNYILTAKSLALLHLAASKGHVEIVRRLIAKGADVNAAAAGVNNFTPLHLAAAAGQIAVIKELLDHGADPRSRTSDNKTPRMYAQQQGQQEAVQLLAEAEGVTLQAALPAASAVASPPAVREALVPLHGSALVMEVKAVGMVPPQVPSVATKILLARLDDVEGLRTVTPEDVQLMLSVEKQKDALGCDDIKCMAEVGGALGTDFVIYGQIAVMGSQYNLSLTAIDSKRSMAVGRVSVLVAANEDALADSIPNTVASLVAKIARTQEEATRP